MIATDSSKETQIIQAEPKPWRWTLEAYSQLFEADFFNGKRVELIFGRIIQMPPQRLQHSVAVELADNAVRQAFPIGFRYRIASPLHLLDKSAPEPDIAVVPGTPRDLQNHPTMAVLIIEVSETSLAYDRTLKMKLYAKTGIEDYWIVNLVDRQIEVHRGPSGRGAGVAAGYASVRIFKADEIISPLAAPATLLRVAELLP